MPVPNNKPSYNLTKKQPFPQYSSIVATAASMNHVQAQSPNMANTMGARENFGSTANSRPGGHQPQPNLHAQDHAAMAADSASWTTPFGKAEYARIQQQAANGCPTCRGIIYGAERGMQTASVHQAQAEAARRRPAPDSSAAIRAAARQAEKALRSKRAAGDRAVAALVQLPAEPVQEFLRRQAETRGYAELAFESKYRRMVGGSSKRALQLTATRLPGERGALHRWVS